MRPVNQEHQVRPERPALESARRISPPSLARSRPTFLNSQRGRSYWRTLRENYSLLEIYRRDHQDHPVQVVNSQPKGPTNSSRSSTPLPVDSPISRRYRVRNPQPGQSTSRLSHPVPVI